VLLDLWIYVYALWMVVCPFSFGNYVVYTSLIYGF
jgi:hypothetical protein